MENFKKLVLQVLKVSLVGALLIITPLLSTSLKFKYLYFIVNIFIIVLCAEAGLLSFLLHKSPENNTYPYSSSDSDSLILRRSAIISDYISPLIINEKVVTIFTTPPKLVKAVVEKVLPLEKILVAPKLVKAVVEKVLPLEKILVAPKLVKAVVEKVLPLDKILVTPKLVKAVVEKCLPLDKILVAAILKVAVLDVPKVQIIKSPLMRSLFFIDNADQEEEEFDENDENYQGSSSEELFQQSETFIGKFYDQLKLQRQKSWNRTETARLYQKALYSN